MARPPGCWAKWGDVLALEGSGGYRGLGFRGYRGLGFRGYRGLGV